MLLHGLFLRKQRPLVRDQCPLVFCALLWEHCKFNKAMNSVRVSVEWLFRDIVEYFKFVDFKKNLKIGLTSIQKCLIKNCINMLLWQHNLRVFWAGYTHLGRVLCLILGRIRTCHTLKNINTFCCVGWWDWGYNILSYVWPQGYFKIKVTESYM